MRRIVSLLLVLLVDDGYHVQGMRMVGRVVPSTSSMISKKLSCRRPPHPRLPRTSCRKTTYLFASTNNNHHHHPKREETTMTTNRRDFVTQGLVGTTTAVVATTSVGTSSSSTNTIFMADAAQQQQEEDQETWTTTTTSSSSLPSWVTEFDSKHVKWNTDNNNNNNNENGDNVPWNQLRYGTSSLEGPSQQQRRQGPPSSMSSTTSTSTPFPSWMEGTWLVSYKFVKATFPQGRDKLNLRMAGAGLGTCIALPNVGYNPSSFTCRYLRNTPKKSRSSTTTGGSSQEEEEEETAVVYEDLAYNVPRRFEAFWPESKVTSIQTAAAAASDNHNNNNRLLTPKCFVTGEGCTLEQNPWLHHVPLSRVAFEFTGPTRRGGYVSQSIDTTQVGGDSYDNLHLQKQEHQFTAYRQYAQFNVNQDLQTFYKELVWLNVPPLCAVNNTSSETTSSCRDEIEEITGRIRVAAFLPPSEAMALSSSSSSSSISPVPYDNTMALAIYDYKIKMKPISEEEASMV